MRRDAATVVVGLFWIAAAIPPLLFSFLLVPAGWEVGSTDPDIGRFTWGPYLGVAMGVVELLWFGGTAALAMWAGAGLVLGRPWAWGMAVLIGVLSPIAFCPVGPFTLFVLLRRGSRRSCGVA